MEIDNRKTPFWWIFKNFIKSLTCASEQKEYFFLYDFWISLRHQMHHSLATNLISDGILTILPKLINGLRSHSSKLTILTAWIINPLHPLPNKVCLKIVGRNFRSIAAGLLMPSGIVKKLYGQQVCAWGGRTSPKSYKYLKKPIGHWSRLTITKWPLILIPV